MVATLVASCQRGHNDRAGAAAGGSSSGGGGGEGGSAGGGEPAQAAPEPAGVIESTGLGSAGGGVNPTGASSDAPAQAPTAAEGGEGRLPLDGKGGDGREWGAQQGGEGAPSDGGAPAVPNASTLAGGAPSSSEPAVAEPPKVRLCPQAHAARTQ